MFGDIKLYGSTTIGSKGQVVIPADARDETGLSEGTRVVILRSPRGDGVLVMRAEAIETMLTKMQSGLGVMTESMKHMEDMK